MNPETVKETVPPPVQIIFDNRRALENYGIENATYTPPGAVDGHYLGQYKWDSCRSGEKLANHGFIKEATEELDTLLSSQDTETGFIPNQSRHVKRPLYKEAEWLFFTSKKYSDYTQPPMEPQLATAIYEAHFIGGDNQAGIQFLSERYDRLKLGMDYFRNFRQDSPVNPLIVNIHTNETGRDSCPTFDFSKLRVRRKGPETSWIVNTINPALDYMGALNLNRKNMKAGWDIQSIRKHFEVTDVMFNCLYVKNLYEMGKIAEALGYEEDMVHFNSLAETVEKAILEQMWDPSARNGRGEFFSMTRGSHIKETTASNLYPMLLPNIPEDKLKQILEIIDSDFDTPFPLPTVSTKSPNFDPFYKEKRVMWRSEVWYWINSDLTIAADIQSQRNELSTFTISRLRGLASRIQRSSLKLVEISPHELHSPITGEGYRTTNFAGAASAWPKPKILSRTVSLAGA